MIHAISSLKGHTLAATDGEIGNVRDVYFDDRTWGVRYLVVNTGAWLLGREVLLSPEALGPVSRDRILVNLTREKVKGAPELETERPVSRQRESAYRQYYGWADEWGAMQAAASVPAPILPVNVLGPDSPPLSGAMGNEAETHDPHLRSAREVTGYKVEATDGEIGHVEDLLLDDESWLIRGVVVDTLNWLPGGFVTVRPSAFREVSWESQRVYLAMTREEVKNAPPYDDPSAPVMPFTTPPAGAGIPGPLPP